MRPSFVPRRVGERGRPPKSVFWLRARLGFELRGSASGLDIHGHERRQKLPETMLRTLRLARVARPQIAALGTTTTCKEKQLPWQLGLYAPRGTHFEFKTYLRGTAYFTCILARRELLTCPGSAKTPSERGRRQQSLRQNPAQRDGRTSYSSAGPRRGRRPRPRRSRTVRTRALTETPRAGAHPFSSFEKTLQGREAVEENLYIRDKEAAAKYKREAELQAERLADASKAFKKEFSQELATMLHQKHLAERQKALRK